MRVFVYLILRFFYDIFFVYKTVTMLQMVKQFGHQFCIFPTASGRIYYINATF